MVHGPCTACGGLAAALRPAAGRGRAAREGAAAHRGRHHPLEDPLGFCIARPAALNPQALFSFSAASAHWCWRHVRVCARRLWMPAACACARFHHDCFLLPREAASPPSPAAACPERCRLPVRSEEHTSELQSQSNLVCRLLLEKKKLHAISSPRSQSLIRHTSSACISSTNRI